MSYLDDFFERRKALRQNSGGKSFEDLRKAESQMLADQRERVVNFKKFFGEEHGRSVMLDLMNKFHILTPLPDTSDPLALARAEGKRDVVLYLLERANTDMAQLDEIMKGNFV